MEELLNRIDNLKADIDALRPLKPLELRQLKEYYRIGQVYSSNAIEGNALTETETKIVIEDGLTVAGKPIRDCLEALGASDSFDFMYRIKEIGTVTEKDILKLHKLFYHRIDIENAGVYRDVKVVVTGTDFIFPGPKEVPILMKEFCENIKAIQKICHPVKSAAKIHSDFVRIHPFVDGNGRMARILMNLILIKNNYPVTIIPPIRRRDYIDSVKKSNKGDEKSFIKLVLEMQIEALRDYLRMFG